MLIIFNESIDLSYINISLDRCSAVHTIPYFNIQLVGVRRTLVVVQTSVCVCVCVFRLRCYRIHEEERGVLFSLWLSTTADCNRVNDSSMALAVNPISSLYSGSMLTNTPVMPPHHIKVVCVPQEDMFMPCLASE